MIIIHEWERQQRLEMWTRLEPQVSFFPSFLNVSLTRELLLLYTDNTHTITPRYGRAYLPHNADNAKRGAKDRAGARAGKGDAREQRDHDCGRGAGMFLFFFILMFSYCIQPPPSPHMAISVSTTATNASHHYDDGPIGRKFYNLLLLFNNDTTTTKEPPIEAQDTLEPPVLFFLLY